MRQTAVEIGLHYSLTGRQTSTADSDDSNRVFWTAYAIEISLAYNLGRPPSISQEHITARLPTVSSSATALGVHHIRHRQIQARIVSQVYYGNCDEDENIQSTRQIRVTRLQSELDEWRLALSDICSGEDSGPYPPRCVLLQQTSVVRVSLVLTLMVVSSYWDRLYHGTTFVLHRASPLCPHPPDESLVRCIRSAGAYIDNMAEVLRMSNVPLSWMLVQGVLFAGLTMLVTARTNYRRLASCAGMTFLLVDLPSWSRKCCVCLAVINERWSEELLPELSNQFEFLADDTLGFISTELTNDVTGSRDYHPHANALAGGVNRREEATSTDHDDTFVSSDASGIGVPLGMDATRCLDISMTGGWESLDLFGNFSGIDDSQTFWGIFAPELDSVSYGPRILLG